MNHRSIDYSGIRDNHRGSTARFLKADKIGSDSQYHSSRGHRPLDEDHYRALVHG